MFSPQRYDALLRRLPDYSPSSHPPFLIRAVCVCVTFSLFLELEISEAQRAHAHSARAHSRTWYAPVVYAPVTSMFVCVLHFFLELEISDFRAGD